MTSIISAVVLYNILYCPNCCFGHNINLKTFVFYLNKWLGMQLYDYSESN